MGHMKNFEGSSYPWGRHKIIEVTKAEVKTPVVLIFEIFEKFWEKVQEKVSVIFHFFSIFVKRMEEGKTENKCG